MISGTIARRAAAGALSIVARAMALGSRVADQVAETVRGAVDEVVDDRDQPADTPVEVGAVSMPPTEPVPDGPSHVRTHETHVEELAERPAAEVVATIGELSTDELGRLYEHESAHKKRKTVLAAIERAVDPAVTPPGHSEPMPEAGGVPTGGGAPR